MATCPPPYSAPPGLSLDHCDLLYHYLVASEAPGAPFYAIPDGDDLVTQWVGAADVLPLRVWVEQLMPVFAAFMASDRSDDTTCLTFWYVVEQAALTWSESDIDGVGVPSTLREHFRIRSAFAKKHPGSAITHRHEYVALCRGPSLSLPFPASEMTESTTLLSMARFPTTSAAFLAHKWIQCRIDGRASRSFTQDHLLASGRRTSLCFANYVSPGDCWSRLSGTRPPRWAFRHCTRAIPPWCSRAPCQWWVQKFHGLQVVNDDEAAVLVDAYLDIFQDCTRRVQRCGDTDQALLQCLHDDAGVPADDVRGWLMPSAQLPPCSGQVMCQCHLNPRTRPIKFRFPPIKSTPRS